MNFKKFLTDFLLYSFVIYFVLAISGTITISLLDLSFYNGFNIYAWTEFPRVLLGVFISFGLIINFFLNVVFYEVNEK